MSVGLRLDDKIIFILPFFCCPYDISAWCQHIPGLQFIISTRYFEFRQICALRGVNFIVFKWATRQQHDTNVYLLIALSERETIYFQLGGAHKNDVIVWQIQPVVPVIVHVIVCVRIHIHRQMATVNTHFECRECLFRFDDRITVIDGGTKKHVRWPRCYDRCYNIDSLICILYHVYQ